MMRLLYPLIASALITIVPFLMTFEKGQDIVRGLFGFSEFALLLLFAWVHGLNAPKGMQQECHPERIVTRPEQTGICHSERIVTRHPERSEGSRALAALRIIALLLIIIAMLVVAFFDLSNLLAIKGWPMGWRVIVPFVTCGLAVAMVWKVFAFKFSSINLILFVALVAHLFAYNNYAAQPLAQFPVIDYLTRTAPKPVQRKNLPETFTNKFIAVDSPSVTKNFMDMARSNVVITVESWGIPLDSNRFNAELKLFEGLIADAELVENAEIADSAKAVKPAKTAELVESAQKLVGANHRMYSRTRTAERENLIYSIATDSITHKRDTTFIPQVLGAYGFETYFLFGGDSTIQWREKYIRNVGFKNVVWNEIRTDGEMAKMLDSLLVQKIDSTNKVFIAWTTRDTRFPLEGLGKVYEGSADANDSAYTERLTGTLKMIADLARRYPQVRFVVQGDHEPILSNPKFQERFYKRWTPFVVLN